MQTAKNAEEKCLKSCKRVISALSDYQHIFRQSSEESVSTWHEGDVRYFSCTRGLTVCTESKVLLLLTNRLSSDTDGLHASVLVQSVENAFDKSPSMVALCHLPRLRTAATKSALDDSGTLATLGYRIPHVKLSHFVLVITTTLRYSRSRRTICETEDAKISRKRHFLNSYQLIQHGAYPRTLRINHQCNRPKRH